MVSKDFGRSPTNEPSDAPSEAVYGLPLRIVDGELRLLPSPGNVTGDSGVRGRESPSEDLVYRESKICVLERLESNFEWKMLIIESKLSSPVYEFPSVVTV